MIHGRHCYIYIYIYYKFLMICACGTTSINPYKNEKTTMGLGTAATQKKKNDQTTDEGKQ